MYNSIPPHSNENVLLTGYFQSYKYFINNWEQICLMINLSEQQILAKRKYSHYFQEDKHTISMHFRLGDYINIQDNHPLMPITYYSKALTYILNKRPNITTKRVLYFCQDIDNKTVSHMINTMQSVYLNVEFVKVDDSISDWEQMLLMSNCDDNIIANSTFSWWGGFFNNNITRVVCYPFIWFGPALTHNVNDLFPSDWQQIVW